MRWECALVACMYGVGLFLRFHIVGHVHGVVLCCIFGNGVCWGSILMAMSPLSRFGGSAT